MGELAILTCQWCGNTFTHPTIYPEDVRKFGKGGGVICPHCLRFTNPNKGNQVIGGKTVSQPQGLSQFDGIRWSQWDEKQNLLLAWHGGHGIHGYTSDGEEVNFWNMGDFSREPTLEDAMENIREHIEKQDYEELY